ncbi:MAG: PAS domain S-box protein [Anaerolineae bacterium]|nr:PAS domain S-box protein [Anaerolineae bacterium]
MKILLIEGNAEDCRRIEQTVKRSVLDTPVLIYQSDLPGSLDAIRSEQPDVIVFDPVLPGCSALDALRSIRENAEEIPIIVLGASSEEEMALQAVKSGAQAYLVKDNLESIMLVCSIRNAVEQKRLEREFRRRIALEELVARISARFIHLSLEEIGQEVNETLRLLGEFIGADGGCVHLFSADGRVLERSYGWVAPGQPICDWEKAGISWRSFRWLRDVLENGETFYFSSLSELPEEAIFERKFFGSCAVKSLLLTPFILNGFLAGSLGFYTENREKEWPDSDVYLIKLIRDIFTNVFVRQQAEKASRRNEQLYRTLAHSLLDSAILVYDENGRHLFAEGGAIDRLGITSGDLLNKSFQEALPGLNLKRIEKAYREALKGKTSRFEFDWNDYSFNMQALPVKGETGSVFAGMAILQDITSFKRSQKVLQSSEERLRTLLNNLPIGVHRNAPGARGEFLMANPAFLKMFGIESEEMLAQLTASDLYPDRSDRQRFSDLLLESKEVQSLLLKLRRMDGTTLWGSVSARVVYDEIGEPAYFDNVIEDITPRIEAESAYRTLVEHSLQALLILQNGRVVFANPAVTTMSGYSLENLLTLSPAEIIKLVHRQDRPMIYRSFRRLENKMERQTRLVFRIMRKDGAVRWIDSVNVAVEFQGKFAIQFISVDVTERREAEEKLRRRLAMETMISSLSTRFIDLPVHKVDAEITHALGELGRFTEADHCFLRFLDLQDTGLKTHHRWRSPGLKPEHNDAYEFDILLNGWARSEIAQNHPLSIQSLDDLPAEAEAIRKSLISLGIGSLLAIPLVSQNKLEGILALGMEDHEKTWQEEDVHLLQMAGEIFLNIIRRCHTEEALRKSEAQYRLLADSIQDVIGLHDLYGKTLYISPSFQKITGLPVQEVLNRNIYEFVAPSSTPGLSDEIREALLQGRDIIFEWRIQHKDGSLLWIETLAHPLLEQDQQPAQWISSSRDITERREAREALRSANLKLQETVEHLERRNQDSSLLIAMGDMLQSCLAQEEIYGVAEKYCRRLFPAFSGALYLLEGPAHMVRKVVSWGDVESPVAFSTENCWALRRGRAHYYKNHGDLICRHVDRSTTDCYLCIPLVALGETVGLFHLNSLAGCTSDHLYQLAVMVSERIALAIVNLRLRETLRDQSIRDPLTELYNRRYLLETMMRELSRANRRKTSIGVMMMDIDHFKIFNDSYGHDVGDHLLQSLGIYLLRNIRGEDVACRYGGEEFVLVLPDTNLKDLMRRANELREGISRLTVFHAGKTLGGITVSIGVSAFPGHGRTMETLLKAADLALYRAKNEGRNRIAEPPES